MHRVTGRASSRVHGSLRNTITACARVRLKSRLEHQLRVGPAWGAGPITWVGDIGCSIEAIRTIRGLIPPGPFSPHRVLQ